MADDDRSVRTSTDIDLDSDEGGNFSDISIATAGGDDDDARNGEDEEDKEPAQKMPDKFVEDLCAIDSSDGCSETPGRYSHIKKLTKKWVGLSEDICQSDIGPMEEICEAFATTHYNTLLVNGSSQLLKLCPKHSALFLEFCFEKKIKIENLSSSKEKKPSSSFLFWPTDTARQNKQGDDADKKLPDTDIKPNRQEKKGLEDGDKNLSATASADQKLPGTDRPNDDADKKMCFVPSCTNPVFVTWPDVRRGGFVQTCSEHLQFLSKDARRRSQRPPSLPQEDTAETEKIAIPKDPGINHDDKAAMEDNGREAEVAGTDGTRSSKADTKKRLEDNGREAEVAGTDGTRSSKADTKKRLLLGRANFTPGETAQKCLRCDMPAFQAYRVREADGNENTRFLCSLHQEGYEKLLKIQADKKFAKRNTSTGPPSDGHGNRQTSHLLDADRMASCDKILRTTLINAVAFCNDQDCYIPATRRYDLFVGEELLRQLNCCTKHAQKFEQQLSGFFRGTIEDSETQKQDSKTQQKRKISFRRPETTTKPKKARLTESEDFSVHKVTRAHPTEPVTKRLRSGKLVGATELDTTEPIGKEFKKTKALHRFDRLFEMTSRRKRPQDWIHISLVADRAVKKGETLDAEKAIGAHCRKCKKFFNFHHKTNSKSIGGHAKQCYPAEVVEYESKQWSQGKPVQEQSDTVQAQSATLPSQQMQLGESVQAQSTTLPPTGGLQYQQSGQIVHAPGWPAPASSFGAIQNPHAFFNPSLSFPAAAYQPYVVGGPSGLQTVVPASSVVPQSQRHHRDRNYRSRSRSRSPEDRRLRSSRRPDRHDDDRYREDRHYRH